MVIECLNNFHRKGEALVGKSTKGPFEAIYNVALASPRLPVTYLLCPKGQSWLRIHSRARLPGSKP